MKLYAPPGSLDVTEQQRQHDATAVAVELTEAQIIATVTQWVKNGDPRGAGMAPDLELYNLARSQQHELKLMTYFCGAMALAFGLIVLAGSLLG